MLENRNVLKKYNLPEKIIFCKKCTISNQRPRIKFDSEGICSACTYADYKYNVIDWNKRAIELEKLCDKYRRNDGRYDVIVPSSGGKDSVYVAHMLKDKYNMHPLTATWSPALYTDIGFENFTQMIHVGGMDNILLTPNGKLHRQLTKAAFLEMGDPFQPFIFGQYSMPFRIALQNDVKLVFYGEDGEVEYGGEMKDADRASLPHESFVKNRFSSVFPGTFEKYDISKNDLKVYGLSKEELKQMQDLKINQYFMSYFHKWIPQENYYYAVENTGFKTKPERNEGTFSKYASIDDKLDGFHYYLMFIKFGLGRCTSDTAHEIRDGHLTRDEGIALVEKFDGEFPKQHFETFLKYCALTENEFWEVIDSWRSHHIWREVKGEWKLRHTIGRSGTDD
jgi:N-acetyl sugar amidotransferase